jgi:hypothetical protein
LPGLLKTRLIALETLFHSALANGYIKNISAHLPGLARHVATPLHMPNMK